MKKSVTRKVAAVLVPSAFAVPLLSIGISLGAGTANAAPGPVSSDISQLPLRGGHGGGHGGGGGGRGFGRGGGGGLGGLAPLLGAGAAVAGGFVGGLIAGAQQGQQCTDVNGNPAPC